jgi:predicted permease
MVLGSIATRAIAVADLPVPPPFNLAIAPTFDLRVFGFAMLATLVAGLLAGLGPALRASRPDLLAALKADQGFRGSRLFGRRALIAVQVGATIVLVVTAGLFLRALGQASSIDLGFEPEGVYALSLDTDLTALPEASAIDLLTRVSDGARALPEIDNAAITALLPLGLPSSMGFGGLTVEGTEPPMGRDSWDASVNVVSMGYFDTMGIALRAGSDFAAQLPVDGPGQAIINSHMAQTFWSGDGAVGQTFRLGDTEYVVQGVAADALYTSLNEEPRFFVYTSHQQRFRAQTYLIARVRGEADTAVNGIRSLAADLAPDMPVLQVVSLRSYADLGLLPQRIAAAVAGTMGAVVILLAAIGIYGVTGQMARRRTGEIGIRMALGADRRKVMRLVMRQGMGAPAVGLVAGLGISLLVTRFLGSLLFGVSPLDPLVFIGGSILLATVAFVANWVPARWAARVDPVRALRAE